MQPGSEAEGTPRLIGIAGPSCAGKTTLAQALCARLPGPAATLSLDAYYRDFARLSAAEQADFNFDAPDALDRELLARHLRALAAGRPVAGPVYDFTTHSRTTEQALLTPGAFVLVEGIFALYWRDGHYFEGGDLLVFKPIAYEDERLGTIFLRADTEALNARLRNGALLVLLVMVVSSLLAYLLSSKLQALVSDPIAQLAQTVRVISNQRDYTLRAKQVGRDDVGRLVEAFNQMLEELQREIGERRQVQEELEKAHRQLQEHQAQMLQAEKMASIGQLAAGVAHELNNPIAFVFSNFSTLEEYIQDLSMLLSSYDAMEEDIRQGDEKNIHATLERIRQQKEDLDLEFILTDVNELITESRTGVERVRNIVLDLKDFSHVDKDQQMPANLNENLEHTLNIVLSDLEKKAELERDYGDIPDVLCHPRELNQAFMGMLLNAAQAIEGRGHIKIRTYHDNGFVCVDIADDGMGISPEVQKRIFEPFFTTKEVGSGTGMGLSLAYNTIVTQHGGQLRAPARHLL